MNWRHCSALVTGAGGFIGSHLVESLLARGARVRAFVRYNSRGDVGLLSLLPNSLREELEIVAGDLRDPYAVEQAAQGVSHIFHLGALIAIPYSYLHPHEVVETNVMGTLNVLMAARRSEAARVVHTSTSEVYGTALSVPISETHPLQGQSPYAAGFGKSIPVQAALAEFRGRLPALETPSALPPSTQTLRQGIPLEGINWK